MRLEGKVAIITGANAGMGRIIAKSFAMEGANVIAADLNVDNSEEMRVAIRNYPGDITACKADMRIDEEIQNMYAVALRQYGRVDAVVNNVGILDNLNAILTTDRELWDNVIQLNLTSVFVSCKRAVEIFIEQEGGGSIINIASVAGVRGMDGGLAYTASKHGVVGITRSIAAMYKDSFAAQHSIRCNAVLPALIDTGMTQTQSIEKYNKETLKKMDTVGAARLAPNGKGEDVAAACVYLASDEARYVNGIILPVDGGSMAV